MENLVTIELFGQPYTFKADTEVAKANEAADLLMREVQKAQDQPAGPSTHIPKLTILILAALNMANHIVQLGKNTGDIVDQMAKRCEALNCQLDEGLMQLRAFRHYG